MVRASSLLDGITAPMRQRLFDPGTKEANLVVETERFFNARADDCRGIVATRRPQQRGGMSELQS